MATKEVIYFAFEAQPDGRLLCVAFKPPEPAAEPPP
jgi:hypothetical protein